MTLIFYLYPSNRTRYARSILLRTYIYIQIDLKRLPPRGKIDIGEKASLPVSPLDSSRNLHILTIRSRSGNIEKT